MRRVDISIPQDVPASIVGFLYESDLPEELGEDMIEVQFDCGLLVDAGWYPESDPEGNYIIKLTNGMQIIAVHETTDVHEAAQFIENFVTELYLLATDK